MGIYPADISGICHDNLCISAGIQTAISRYCALAVRNAQARAYLSVGTCWFLCCYLPAVSGSYALRYADRAFPAGRWPDVSCSRIMTFSHAFACIRLHQTATIMVGKNEPSSRPGVHLTDFWNRSSCTWRLDSGLNPNEAGTACDTKDCSMGHYVWRNLLHVSLLVHHDLLFFRTHVK